MKDPEATPQNMNASLGLQQQLANNIKAGEQLVQDYRKQVSALREKAAKERATVGDLHRTAVHMKIELETKKRELGGLNALLAMAKREHDNAAQEMPPSASENQISTATAEMSQPPDVRSGSDAQAKLLQVLNAKLAGRESELVTIRRQAEAAAVHLQN